MKAGCVVVGKKTFQQYFGDIYPVASALNIVLSRETENPKKDNIICIIWLKTKL
ncbi:MAG: hypothetical protein ABI430_04750 [Candidatus Taylorbacteria bacterium]